MRYSLNELFVLLAVFLCSAVAEPTLISSFGRITGKLERIEGLPLVESFLGIPYAKPPIGDLRFAYPQPATPVGDLIADKFSPSCHQPNGVFQLPGSQSEDCLYLNVFRKAETQQRDNKPVIVIIHGGGFVVGSTAELIYTGVPLASYQDVIVVTVNYRLGVFGFADFKDAASGNVGLFDQRLALEWINSNIQAFGGDPDRVTLMGVSAGSIAVHAQIITPLNRVKQIFHAAIMDAGILTPGPVITQEVGYERIQMLAKALNCSTTESTMPKCLREKNANTIIETAASKFIMFQPTMDGKFISSNSLETSGDHAIKIMVGFGKDEGTLSASTRPGSDDVPVMSKSSDFVDYCARLGQYFSYPIDFTNSKVRQLIADTYFEKTQSHFNDTAQFILDGSFSCPTNAFVKNYAKSNHDMYVYHFHRKMSVKFQILDAEKLGVYHMSPFIHFAGSFLTAKTFYSDFADLSADDRLFFQDSMKLIGDFVKSKEKHLKFRNVKWPKFDINNSKILVIDEIPSVKSGLFNERNCKAIFSFYEQSPKHSSVKGEL